jgi:hypothetical protein
MVKAPKDPMSLPQKGMIFAGGAYPLLRVRFLETEEIEGCHHGETPQYQGLTCQCRMKQNFPGI